ncbi:hypothetical protein Pmar_PMAR026387 [Perkinsus marinus ATCC 50983]|uniref:Uncharacterized protein n=1 Tax=Perkinsus marinus (strain ATCC 50983 / TXsc) TaxID=423536 RepID=C5LEL7_PERM5|nr:hypothetical protein Pmar_PMAR026387 [Perkinsus marinus ATCC 50983]EER04835.1 hypothetical protein Pmar_PMAR026387 [Perkinsus marinus ATCC 50983]|eukprot:XP_002773019.1 hypothetical protein Pmar_PMAR026387 [Perkinsus marinus ATCC 50983]
MDPKLIMYVNRVTEAIAKVNLEMGKIRSKVDEQASELTRRDDEIAELRSQLEDQGNEIKTLKQESACLRRLLANADPKSSDVATSPTWSAQASRMRELSMASTQVDDDHIPTPRK